MFYRHKTRGSVYQITGLRIDSETMETRVDYADVETGLPWSRPAHEFFDGRFEVYIAPKPAPDGGYVQ